MHILYFLGEGGGWGHTSDWAVVCSCLVRGQTLPLHGVVKESDGLFLCSLDFPSRKSSSASIQLCLRMNVSAAAEFMIQRSLH